MDVHAVHLREELIAWPSDEGGMPRCIGEDEDAVLLPIWRQRLTEEGGGDVRVPVNGR